MLPSIPSAANISTGWQTWIISTLLGILLCFPIVIVSLLAINVKKHGKWAEFLMKILVISAILFCILMLVFDIANEEGWIRGVLVGVSFLALIYFSIMFCIKGMKPYLDGNRKTVKWNWHYLWVLGMIYSGALLILFWSYSL